MSAFEEQPDEQLSQDIVPLSDVCPDDVTLGFVGEVAGEIGDSVAAHMGRLGVSGLSPHRYFRTFIEGGNSLSMAAFNVSTMNEDGSNPIIRIVTNEEVYDAVSSQSGVRSQDYLVSECARFAAVRSSMLWRREDGLIYLGKEDAPLLVRKGGTIQVKQNRRYVPGNKGDVAALNIAALHGLDRTLSAFADYTAEPFDEIIVTEPGGPKQ